MKDLNDRTQELLAAFRESGYCTECWVNLNEEDHEPKCPLSGGGQRKEDRMSDKLHEAVDELLSDRHLELLVQDVCDRDPEHQYHLMDCGPDLERLSGLTRLATDDEILSHPAVQRELEANQRELDARERYGAALSRGLSDAEAREEGWPSQ